MRIATLILLASVAGGCTSVKIVQRDGCWVKRTEKIFGRVIEDLGPCRRAEPQWAEDRVTRLVQECVAQADYRWSVRANEAWAKGAPYPAQPPQQELLRTCMEEARIGLVPETEALKARLSEVTGDRDSLRVGAEQDHAKLRESHEKIVEWLGQAAQKPAGTATATATSTSDGKASNETGATLAAERGPPAPAGPPVSQVSVVVPAAPTAVAPAGPIPDPSTAPASAPAAAPASPPSPAPRDTPKRERSSQLRARTPLARTPAVRAVPSCDPPTQATAPCDSAAAASAAPR